MALAEEVIEDYKRSLADLNFNSKPLINMLTMLADDHEQHAPVIVKVIEDHILKAKAGRKLSVLYLIDSIIKNLPKSAYRSLFMKNIVHTFTSVFEQVDEKTRASMFKLRQTWTGIFPNKPLYNIDVKINTLMDPAWPITAKKPEQSIHVNPKFLRQPEVEPEVIQDTAEDLQKQEALMRQQLIAKQQELLKLKQQKLELELAETQAQLEQQEKSNKSRLLHNLPDSTVVQPPVPPVQVTPVPVVPSPVQEPPPVETPAPAPRDPRLAARDPRRSRDPRLRGKESPAAVSSTPDSTLPKSTGSSISAAGSLPQVTNISAFPPGSRPLPKMNSLPSFSPTAPIQLHVNPNFVNPPHFSGEMFPPGPGMMTPFAGQDAPEVLSSGGGHFTGEVFSPDAPINTDQKAQSVAQPQQRPPSSSPSPSTSQLAHQSHYHLVHQSTSHSSHQPQPSSSKSANSHKDSRGAKPENGSTKSRPSASPRESGNFGSGSKGRKDDTTARRGLGRNSKDREKETKDRTSRDCERERSRSPHRNSPRSPRSSGKDGGKSIKSRETKSRRSDTEPTKKKEVHESERSSDSKDNQRDKKSSSGKRKDVSTSKRSSHDKETSSVHSKSPVKSKSRNSRHSAEKDDLQSKAVKQSSKKTEENVSAKKDIKAEPKELVASMDENAAMVLNDLRNEVMDTGAADRPQLKRDLDPEHAKKDEEAGHGPTAVKKPRVEEEKISEDISDLFGGEDQDYRSVKSQEMDSRGLPIKSPSSKGWDKFKASHPEHYAYDIELKKQREEARDVDQRLGRSQSMVEDIDLRFQRQSSSSWQERQDRERRLSGMEDVLIPQALASAKHADILREADRKLREGSITHDQHQELLKQLTELMHIQRLQEEKRAEESTRRKLDVGDSDMRPPVTPVMNQEQVLPVKMEVDTNFDRKQLDRDMRMQSLRDESDSRISFPGVSPSHAEKQYPSSRQRIPSGGPLHEQIVNEEGQDKRSPTKIMDERRTARERSPRKQIHGRPDPTIPDQRGPLQNLYPEDVSRSRPQDTRSDWHDAEHKEMGNPFDIPLHDRKKEDYPMFDPTGRHMLKRDESGKCPEVKGPQGAPVKEPVGREMPPDQHNFDGQEDDFRRPERMGPQDGPGGRPDMPEGPSKRRRPRDGPAFDGPPNRRGPHDGPPFNGPPNRRGPCDSQSDRRGPLFGGRRDRRDPHDFPPDRGDHFEGPQEERVFDGPVDRHGPHDGPLFEGPPDRRGPHEGPLFEGPPDRHGPHDGPPFEGPPDARDPHFDGPYSRRNPRDGPGRRGPRDGPFDRRGPPFDGPTDRRGPRDHPPYDGPPDRRGPPDGPPFDGPPDRRGPPDGPPDRRGPHDGPPDRRGPHDGPPDRRGPHDGPPYDGPKNRRGPHDGPPFDGPTDRRGPRDGPPDRRGPRDGLPDRRGPHDGLPDRRGPHDGPPFDGPPGRRGPRDGPADRPYDDHFEDQNEENNWREPRDKWRYRNERFDGLPDRRDRFDEVGSHDPNNRRDRFEGRRGRRGRFNDRTGPRDRKWRDGPHRPSPPPDDDMDNNRRGRPGRRDSPHLDIPHPAEMDQNMPPTPNTPGADPRWKNFSDMGPEVSEEVIIGKRPYEIKVGGVPRKINFNKKMIEVSADPVTRGVLINGNLVYKFGERVKDVDIMGQTVKLFYHGQLKNLWIDGQHYEVRVDAPPKQILINGKPHKLQIDGRDMMILIDKSEKGPYGTEPRFIYVDEDRLELRFEPLPKTIMIDGKLCELKLNMKIPCVVIDGRMHGISFDGPPREVIIDDRCYIVHMDKAIKHRIGNRPHYIAFGGPCFELIIDGKWFEVRFGEPPKDINIGSRILKVHLPGVPPEVKILDPIGPAGPPGMMMPGPGPAPGPYGPMGPNPFAVSVGPDGQVPFMPIGPGGQPVSGGPAGRGQMFRQVGPGPLPSGPIQPGVDVRPQFLPGQTGPFPQQNQMVPEPPKPPAGLGLGFPGPGQPQFPMSATSQEPVVSAPPLQSQPVSSATSVGGGVGSLLSSLFPPAAQAPPTSSSSAPIDINSLFSKLVATGIIKGDNKSSAKTTTTTTSSTTSSTNITVNTASDTTTTTSTTSSVEGGVKQELLVDTASQDSTDVKTNQTEVVFEEIDDLTDFEVASLKKLQNGVIQRLHAGIQCTSCGARFTLDDEEKTDKYREHLDWHFRANRREKDEVKVAKYRKWYYSVDDWVQYEEIADTEEQGRSNFFEQMLNPSDANTSGQLQPQISVPEGATVIKCPPATGNDNDDMCDICHEEFEQFWNEEQEEWHLRDAIRVNDKTYHPICYEDHTDVTPSPSDLPTEAPFFKPAPVTDGIPGIQPAESDSINTKSNAMDTVDVKSEPVSSTTAEAPVAMEISSVKSEVDSSDAVDSGTTVPVSVSQDAIQLSTETAVEPGQTDAVETESDNKPIETQTVKTEIESSVTAFVTSTSEVKVEVDPSTASVRSVKSEPEYKPMTDDTDKQETSEDLSANQSTVSSESTNQNAPEVKEELVL